MTGAAFAREPDYREMPANTSVYPVVPRALDALDLPWCCPDHPTVAEAWLGFLQHCGRRVRRGNLALETVRRYAELRARLDELGALLIRDLAGPAAYQWHEYLGAQTGKLTQRPTARTADACRDLLAQVCDWAELQGWRSANTNPIRAVPRFGSVPRDVRLEEAEVRATLAALDQIEARRLRRRFRDPLRQAARGSATQLLRCMYLWSRRPRELRLLRFDQLVDLDGRRPLARRVRTKKGLRSLAIPRAVAELLVRQRGIVGALSPLVFPSGQGTPLTTLWHTWAEVRAVAGLPPMPLYVLRHTGATLLLEAGESHDDAASFLGNTAETLRRHYDHAVVSPLEEATAIRCGATLARIGGVP